MFTSIINFFSKSKGKQVKDKGQAESADRGTVKQDGNKISSRLIDKHIKDIEICEVFKETQSELLARHAAGELNLLKQGEVLTIEQKRELGLNTRRKYTTAFVECLNLTKISPSVDPVYELEKIHRHIMSIESIREHIRKAQKIGVVKKFEFCAASDDRTCEWCKATDGKLFDKQEQIDVLVQQSCKCEWCRAVLLDITE